MRILLVHNRYTQRGGEDAVFEAEAALLREHGHDVFIWEETNDRLQTQSQISAAANAIWSVSSQKTLAHLLETHRPQLVHFHNTFLRISPAAYYTCQRAGIPVVQSLHNYRLLCPAATLFRDGHICEECLGGWGLWPSIRHRCWHSSRSQTAVVASMLVAHRWLQTWTEQVNLYIALTEFARLKFITGGLPAEKIVIKPNFVASTPVIPTSVTPKPYPSRSRFALYVGRLSSEKGIALLLKAWQKLPRIPLKIVGDGPLRGEVEEYVRRYGLQQVEFYGNCNREKVFALMQDASLLVVPSVCYEGLPLTIIEAFACSLPVVASRLGAMAEIVQHQETGALFQAHDAADLARWVGWAWEHPAEMQRIAENAYQEYQTSYSAAKNYERLMQIYEQAIAARPLKSSPHNTLHGV